MWWDADRIERTVTRAFVCSHLLPEEVSRLDLALGFGDGLTDGTYWEWIDEKAKRIFLVLVDLGVPDQIFGIIDDSWDDQDLPVPLDQVERLALTASRDEKLEKRFYYRQFHYLLRPIEYGEHVIYSNVEVVPIDVLEKRGAAVDKVEIPDQRGQTLCRTRIPLGAERGCLSPEDFLYEINSIRNLQNEHLVSYYASYVHQGYGYVLFTPASDFNLKAMLATVPNSVKNLDKPVRRQLIVEWVHCLVDTLCFIHNRNLSHGNIRPSTILFNDNNHIFFSDFTPLSADMLDMGDEKSFFDKESYNYAAPEQWFKPAAGPTSPIHRKATLSSMSSSPDDTAFSISRAGAEHHSNTRPQAMTNSDDHYLNPQAADIFSLGCIILELLGILLKRQTRAFAAHRGAKHKTAGRGGAVLDSSFHKNLGQVETWMTGLAKDAARKDDPAFRGIVPMLHVVERMLAYNPTERPSARDVQTRMYQIIREDCGIDEPHCVHQYGGWDFGMGSLKLMSPTLSAPPIPPSSSYGFYEDADGMSIMTKSSSSSGGNGAARVRSLQHSRTHSSGGSSSGRAYTHSKDGQPRERDGKGREKAPKVLAFQGGGRSRHKTKPPQALYAS
jgi:serine/threonine protein kinase